MVDIPLAPFFLSHLLQRHHSTCYNYLDELSSFDKQIYTSLNFIKVTLSTVAFSAMVFAKCGGGWDSHFYLH